MYLAQRTRGAIRAASIAVAIYGAVVAALAWAFPGSSTFGGSFLRWLLGIPIALAIYGVSEFGIGKLLSMSVWERMPSIARVLVLVFLVALATVALIIAGEHWNA